MIKGTDGKEAIILELQKHLLPLIGRKLFRIQTAQLTIEDDGWHDWFDLPVRLFFEEQQTISIAWSYFDKLFISDDLSIPFEINESEVRWITNGIQCFSPMIGQKLKNIQLGEGYMEIDANPIEIWTRLALEFDAGWMEIYNGLDENAFAFHKTPPTGNFENVNRYS